MKFSVVIVLPITFISGSCYFEIIAYYQLIFNCNNRKILTIRVNKR